MIKTSNWVYDAAQKIASEVVHDHLTDGEGMIRKVILEHCPFKPDKLYMEVVPQKPGHVWDWAARAGVYLHAEGLRLSSHRIAAVIAYFAEPLMKLLNESKREHYHCDDSWYCCGKCIHSDHVCCPGGEDHEHDAECYLCSHDGAASRVSGICNCGADEWNKWVDEVLHGSDS